MQPGPGQDLVVASSRPRDDAACLHYPHLRHGIFVDLTRGIVRGQGIDRLRGVRCVRGTVHADRIVGTPQRDVLYACEWSFNVTDQQRNVIRAGAGNDEVGGCDGPDHVDLGDGNDVGIGADGDDWIYGEAGNDQSWGIDGSDHLEGGDGDDQVNGTYYCDTASSAGTGMGDPSPNQVYGGNGIDSGYGGPTRNPGDDRIISVERRTSCP